jgi:hypothetical protein
VSIDKPLPTWEMPRQTVLRRWRQGDVTMAELECGHTEPATGFDMYKAIRCPQCNPVKRRTVFEPVEGWND